MIYNFTKKIDNLSPKKMWIIVLGLFLFSVLLRSLFIIGARSAYVSPDEFIYLDLAKSICYHGSLDIHNVTTDNMAILYPILIAPIMLISNSIMRITLIGIVNTILMSSTIFPVYILSKKIISRNTINILLCSTVLFLPDMCISMTFMSENLFFPLTVWLFVVIYKFIEENKEIKKITYICIIAILCNLIYMTKVISLYLVIGFIMMLILDAIFIKNNSIIKNVSYSVSFLILFFAIKKSFEIFIYEKIFKVTLLSSSLAINMLNPEKIKFLIYACIFTLLCTIVAFFYFPIVIPLFNIKNLNRNLKNLLAFGLASLITVIGVVSYIIYLNEQYNVLGLRQHLRYYSPLIIIFLVIFYYIISIHQKERDILKSSRVGKKILIIITTLFFCVCFILLFKLFYGVCVDGLLLQYIYNISKYYNIYKPSLLNTFEILIKIIISVFILKGTYNFLKNKKNAVRFVIIIIFISCLINNICAIITFRSEYQMTEAYTKNEISQIETINKYLNHQEGNVLVICNGYDMKIETYLTHSAYYTATSKILSKMEKRDFIDLSIDKITCLYPSVEYTDLNKIDYILTDNSLEISGKVRKVELNGVKEYSLYKNMDTKILNCRKITKFPSIEGQVKKLFMSNLASNFTLNSEGNYISSSDFSEGNYVAYGPFDYLKAGEYRVTYHYKYSGAEKPGSEIGNVDIFVNDILQSISVKKVIAGNNKISLNFATDRDYKNVEIRMQAYTEGLELSEIEIEKIK